MVALQGTADGSDAEQPAPIQPSELAALLRRVAEQERQAFELLYRVTSAKMYGIIVRIVPQAGADAVLQDVYVDIWERAARFDRRTNDPFIWMTSITRRRALDEVRKVAPKTLADLAETYEPPAENGHPLDNLVRSTALDRLTDRLAAVDPVLRQIIMLAYYRGLGREQLATRFGLPVAGVRSSIRNALASLAQKASP